MRIAILVEGQTERAFIPHLRDFLKTKLVNPMPKLDSWPYNGRIPTGDKLKRVVQNLLNDRKTPADAVIALTDVYTGSNPPEFQTAEVAKQKMRGWVGEEPRFYPHVALHDFEAWLLPYWPKIQKLAGSNQNPPAANPEKVNHGHPPAHLLSKLFLSGNKKCAYVKTRDVGRILKDADLMVTINACSELKAFVNRILTLCDSPPIP